MNIKPLEIVWAVLIILILDMTALSIQAQEQYCPDTKYIRKNSLIVEDVCFYENDITFNPTIYDLKTCESHLAYYKDKKMEIDKEYRMIKLHSMTHSISVSVRLNRKEFKDKNRDYWIQKGMEFLHNLEKANESCLSVEKSVHPVETGTIRKSDDGKKSVPVENKKTKSSWDDLTAPSAK